MAPSGQARLPGRETDAIYVEPAMPRVLRAGSAPDLKQSILKRPILVSVGGYDAFTGNGFTRRAESTTSVGELRLPVGHPSDPEIVELSLNPGTMYNEPRK